MTTGQHRPQSAQLVPLRGSGDIYWAEQFRQAYLKTRLKDIVQAHRISEARHIAALMRAINRHPLVEGWTHHLTVAQTMIEEDYRRYIGKANGTHIS